MYVNQLVIDLQNRSAAMKRAAREQRGAAMAEYGLLLALVALAAIGVLALFGREIIDIFAEASDTLKDRGNVPSDTGTP